MASAVQTFLALLLAEDSDVILPTTDTGEVSDSLSVYVFRFSCNKKAPHPIDRLELSMVIMWLHTNPADLGPP